MLALIVAVISLSSIAPDPIVTPAAALADRLSAGTGFASAGSAAPSGFSSDITVMPACTFGAPQFGSSLWNDAASLSRTLTQPTCAGMGTGSGFSAPWLPAFGSGFVQLDPARLYSGSGLQTTFQAPLPARFTVLPQPLLKVQTGPVLRQRAGAEPIVAHAPMARLPVERRH